MRFLQLQQGAKALQLTCLPLSSYGRDLLDINLDQKGIPYLQQWIRAVKADALNKRMFQKREDRNMMLAHLDSVRRRQQRRMVPTKQQHLPEFF